MSPDDRADDRPNGGYSFVRKKPTSAARDLGDSSERVEPLPREPQAVALPDESLPLPPPRSVEAGPPPIDLNAAELVLGPGPTIDLEAPPEPALDLASPDAGAGFESPSFHTLETDDPDEEPGWGVDVAEVPKLPSPFERTGSLADRAPAIKRFLPPPPEPWWKRRMPHMIVGAILLACSSYVYGCTKVMGDSIGFRRELPEISTELRNLDGAWETITPSKVERAVKHIADRHDMDVRRVDIFAEEIGQIERPDGMGCAPKNWPDTIQKLDGVDQMNLVKAGKVCAIPNFILTVRAHVSERWGLFKHGTDEVAYILLNRYSGLEEIAAP
jgi:hypothetical protein